MLQHARSHLCRLAQLAPQHTLLVLEASWHLQGQAHLHCKNDKLWKFSFSLILDCKSSMAAATAFPRVPSHSSPCASCFA